MAAKRFRLKSNVHGLVDPDDRLHKRQSFGPNDDLPAWVAKQVHPSRLVEVDKGGEPKVKAEPKPEPAPEATFDDGYDALEPGGAIALAQAREIEGAGSFENDAEAITALRARDAADAAAL